MLYKKFSHNLDHLLEATPAANIAIAVSGGSDSIALLILMSKWAKDHNTSLTVMSVNHHLREQSIQENEYICNLSHSLGYVHHQLHWNPRNNYSNLQARARQGRYQLMTDLCLKLDILTLLTAHHLDDYVENFCIRLERKSGIFGLSGSNVSWFNNVRILKPFSDIPKQQLVEYLVKNNIKWFEDESNNSDKYQRNVIRKNLAKQPLSTTLNLARTDANNQVKSSTPIFITAIAESVKIHDYGFGCVNLLKFLNFPIEIKLHLISFMLITIRGNNHNPRSHSLELIITLLKQKKDFTKTLHGCIIKRIGDNLLIYREFGKSQPNDIALREDDKWDDRFRVKYFNSNKNNITSYVTHLTVPDYSNIRKCLDLELLKYLTLNNHKSILFTLPIIKRLEKVIAIPHISYYDDKSLLKEYQISFEPNFTSRFTHFY